VVSWEALRHAGGRRIFFAMGMGFAATILPYAIYLVVTRQWDAYWNFNWWLNMNIGYRVRAGFPFWLSFRRDFFIWIMAGVGLLLALMDARKNKEAAFFIFAGMVLAATFFFIPVVYRHYLLPLVPFVAILAARMLKPMPRPLRWGFLSLAVALFGLGFWTEPIKQNTRQIAAVERILAETAPDERVFALHYPINLFRPDTGFFWFGFQPNNVRDTWAKRQGETPDDYKAIFQKKPAVVVALEERFRHPILKDFYDDSGEYVLYRERVVRVYLRKPGL
jgi:hypothetical protein